MACVITAVLYLCIPLQMISYAWQQLCRHLLPLFWCHSSMIQASYHVHCLVNVGRQIAVLMHVSTASIFQRNDHFRCCCDLCDLIDNCHVGNSPHVAFMLISSTMALHFKKHSGCQKQLTAFWQRGTGCLLHAWEGKIASIQWGPSCSTSFGM